MREDPAPPAWRAELDLSWRRFTQSRDWAQKSRAQPQTGFIQVLENFSGDAEDTRTSVFASEVKIGSVRFSGALLRMRQDRSRLDSGGMRDQ